MIGPALRDYLLSIGPLTDLVAARVYPVLAPQPAVYPRVLTQLAGLVRHKCLRGGALLDKGTARFTLACQSRGYDEAWAVAREVLGYPGAERLDNLAAVIGPGGGVRYKVVARVEDVREDADPPAHGEGVWDVSVILDVTLNYEEIIP